MKIQRTNSVSVHLAILRVAGVLVPSQQRAEWFAEWRAELWYARQSCVRESQMAPGNVDVTAFCLGAFKDALWLRRNRPRRKVRDIFCLDSPSRCLVLLAGLGAISLLSAYLLLGTLESNAREEPSPVRAFLMIIGFACLIAPATTALSLGDYPASCHAPSLATRLRRWIFLAAKIGFILPIVYGGALHMRYFSVTGRDVAANFLVHALLWGGVFALGWVLRDQRRRCPVCLRLLTNPVRVGQAAGYFLEWNCTELMCLRGHGLLYVPENSTSWFTVQRWLYLDSSWSGLCSGARLP